MLRDGPNAVAPEALLGDAFRAGWNAKRAADGYRPSRFADSMQQYVDDFEQVPVVVLVCLDRYRAPSPYEGASVYPACQNLLLAARALGYGGALTMWHLGVEAELRELLAIPERRALSACITLGVPGRPPRAVAAQAARRRHVRRRLGPGARRGSNVRAMTLVAGVDSSTQSTKVEIRDLDTGRVVGAGSAPHPA